MKPLSWMITASFLGLSSWAPAQDEPVVVAGEAPAMPESPRQFHLGAEVKTHFRHSTEVAVPVLFPFPESFLAPGQTRVFERTVARGSSFEVSTVNINGDAEFTPHIRAGLQVSINDLYERNPTSSDDRVFLRKAWLRFGQKREPLDPSAEGREFYLQFGKFSRFTRPVGRQLESWGLWGTAVGRFEELQLEAGGSLGGNLYWRAQLANGNPLFFRDPNALAGDNGTPERQPQPGPRPVTGVHPIYESGFPILYDAKAQDLNVDGNFQYGLGLGFRSGGGEASTALDLLGFYVQRKLEREASIRGSFYLGDETLLQGVLFPLPFSGDQKKEYGVNLQARAGRLRAFAQVIGQDIESLKRQGVEVELAWHVDLPAPFVSGDTPVLTWIRPVIRFSSIDNKFEVPALNPAPSLGWDWRKIDIGVRLGVVADVDLTAEYSLNSMRVPPREHPNEFLVTLRAAF